MKIIDSSVIIAAFRKQEQNNKKALQVFISNEKFLILDYVLSEVLTVLKMRENFETAKKCHDFLSNTKDIEIAQTEPEIFEKALRYFSTNRNNLSFVDTVILTSSKENNMGIITFDKDLKKKT